MARVPKRKPGIAECDARESCCQIVAIVSVDARGQMVLPKELREQAGIAPGDKLAVTALRQGGRVVCLTLCKANDLGSKIEELLRPVFLGSMAHEAAKEKTHER